MRRRLLGAAIAVFATLAPAMLSAGEQEDKLAAQQIATELRDSGKLHNYSLGVKVQGSTVWLNGRVASKQQMADALQHVSDMDGVAQIVNNLEVAQGDGARRASYGASTKRGAQGAAANKQPAGVRLASAQARMAMDTGAPAGDESSEAVPAGYYPLPHRAAMATGCPGGPGCMTTTGGPMPAYLPGVGGGVAPSAYDEPHLPNYSWPSYASYPNYAALTYPKQYSATAWPFIGPFYPYPQVPLGWRKVSLEWDDGWWFLDFQDRSCH